MFGAPFLLAPAWATFLFSLPSDESRSPHPIRNKELPPSLPPLTFYQPIPVPVTVPSCFLVERISPFFPSARLLYARSSPVFFFRGESTVARWFFPSKSEETPSVCSCSPLKKKNPFKKKCCDPPWFPPAIPPSPLVHCPIGDRVC